MSSDVLDASMRTSGPMLRSVVSLCSVRTHATLNGSLRMRGSPLVAAIGW